MSNNSEEITLDRKDLKILALRESLSKKEEEVADLKVELHIALGQIQQLNAALQDANSEPETEDEDAEKEED